jgi:hypothetical protein
LKKANIFDGKIWKISHDGFMVLTVIESHSHCSPGCSRRHDPTIDVVAYVCVQFGTATDNLMMEMCAIENSKTN